MMRRLRELALWSGALLGLLAVVAGVAVTFFGFSFLVFRSGSMEPEIPTGGIALARTVPAGELRTGDVVSVIADNGERITHRIQSVAVRGGVADLVLKGDANATADSEVYQVTEAERVVGSLPWGGYVVAHALTPPGLVAVACLSAMLFVLGGGRDRDQSETDRGDDEPPAGPGPGDGELAPATAPRGGRHAAARRTWVGRGSGAVAVLAAAALATTGTAGTLASFTDKATTATGTFAAARFFDCDGVSQSLAGAPYLYWKLDEQTGLLGLNPSTANDSSTNNRPGAYFGGFTVNADRACADDSGSAVTFDGSSGGIGAPLLSQSAVAGPNVFTLSLWFKTAPRYGRGGKLIGFGNQRQSSSGSYDRHIYMTNAGKLTFGVYPGAIKTVTSPLSYNDGKWHYVVASLSSAGMRLFVDGSQVASRTDTTTAEPFNGYWRIAFDNLNTWTDAPTSPYFAGTLDEVAVFIGSVPTAGDVQLAYEAGL